MASGFALLFIKDGKVVDVKSYHSQAMYEFALGMWDIYKKEFGKHWEWIVRDTGFNPDECLNRSIATALIKGKPFTHYDFDDGLRRILRRVTYPISELEIWTGGDGDGRGFAKLCRGERWRDIHVRKENEQTTKIKLNQLYKDEDYRTDKKFDYFIYISNCESQEENKRFIKKIEEWVELSLRLGKRKNGK